MNTARRWASSEWLRVRAHRRGPPHSPRGGLRRAARAALVMPPVFAFAQVVIRDAQVALFVPFGCIALLVMVDIGGPDAHGHSPMQPRLASERYSSRSAPLPR
jgi:hypothetical protein